MNYLNNFDYSMINKYNIAGSYYTSYPTVQQWSTEYTSQDHVGLLNDPNLQGKEFPLSLYLHFPFCAKLCYFCICHMKVTNNRSTMDDFLDYFCLEIDRLSQFFERNSLIPRIQDIHFGGGSPTHMDEKQFDRLVKKLESLVYLKDLKECALEIDIRTVNRDRMRYYHEKGISRISLGVQDFDAGVQQAVNRIQPQDLFENLLTSDIKNYFKGINFDLIFGLPLQTRKTFQKTMEIVKSFDPDRLSVYNYCHNPESYKHQLLIKDSQLPEEEEKTMMGVETVQDLLESGYERIGIDHFAKITDDLAQSKRDRTLHRSFMGYTVGRTETLIGIGPSALSAFPGGYAQNVYSFQNYRQALNDREFPVFRGYIMKREDLIRRDVMHQFLCHFFLDFKTIEEKYGINFRDYFKEELGSLDELVQDGLLELSVDAINVTSLGEFFVRHICKVFDKY